MPPRKTKHAARRKPARRVSTAKAVPPPAVVPLAESGQAIAVTGLNRFLGNEILRWLIADGSRRVIAIDIKRPQGEWPRNFVYYKVDLTDPIADQALSDIFKEEKVGTVLHAAFHDFPQPDTSQAHELESIGTMNVLHAVAGTDVRKLVVTSTTMVYGADPKNPTYLAEESPLLPTRTYSFISDKVDAERQLAQFRKQHPAKRVTILRFAPLVGPRGDHLMNHILSLPVVPRVMGFDPLMQLLHEDDAVDAIKRVLSEDHAGIFNIVPAQVLPFSTIIKIAGRLALPLPGPSLGTAMALMWISGLGSIPPGHRRYLQYLCVAAGDRMRQALGFAPRYTTRQALESYLGTSRLRRLHIAERPVA